MYPGLVFDIETEKYPLYVFGYNSTKKSQISAFGENERSVFNPTSLNLFFGLTDLLNLILSGCVEGTKKHSGISASLHWVRTEFTFSTLFNQISLFGTKSLVSVLDSFILEPISWWSLRAASTIVFLEFLESRSNKPLRFLGNGL